MGKKVSGTLCRIGDFRSEQEQQRAQEWIRRGVYKEVKNILLRELTPLLNDKKRVFSCAFAAILFSFLCVSILYISAAVMKNRVPLLSRFALAFNIIALIPCLLLTLVSMSIAHSTTCFVQLTSIMKEKNNYSDIKNLLSEIGIHVPGEVEPIFCEPLMEDVHYCSVKAHSFAKCFFILTLMMCVGLCIGIADTRRYCSNKVLSNVSLVYNAALVSAVIVLLVLDAILVMGRFEYVEAKPVYNHTYGRLLALSYQPLEKEQVEVVY